MSSQIERYMLGDIEVVIEETDHPEKLSVNCNDGTFKSHFTIRRYEYQNYKRHMNQRIKNAYREEHGSDTE